MLVRLFETRAEDLGHLVGELAAPGRTVGFDPIAWSPGTRCLEVALAPEERQLPDGLNMGAVLARVWTLLLPAMLPEDAVGILRVDSTWDAPAGLSLLANASRIGRRFVVAGGSRARLREGAPPLTGAIELDAAEMSEAIVDWGYWDDGITGIDVLAVEPAAAHTAFASRQSGRPGASPAARHVRLYMTPSRDQRSLFMVSSHTADTLRAVLQERATL